MSPTNNLFTSHIRLIYMYEQDLALNNLQGLIRQLTYLKPFNSMQINNNTTTCGVMVSVSGKWQGEPSSNPGQVCLHFT